MLEAALIYPTPWGTMEPAAPASRITGDAYMTTLTDDAALDRFLCSALAEHRFKSMGVLLCDEDGAFYAKSFGSDTLETRHLLASATKLASATAAISVVDDGLVGLDDPIGKFLPTLGPHRRGITIRQLFAQTHGMPAHHPSIPLPQQANGMSLAEAVDRIAEDDAVDFEPGSKHSYQPAVSYHIAGRIAEMATGEDWATLFEKRVRGPLEMTGFSYGDTPNPRIGGGAMCALRDYGNLVQMHLAGGVFKGRRLLSESIVREMQTDQLRGAPFTPSPAAPGNVGYGLAWWFSRLDETGAARLITVPGAWGATPWIDRKRRYGGFLLVEEPLRRLKRVLAFFETLTDHVESLLPSTESPAH